MTQLNKLKDAIIQLSEYNVKYFNKSKFVREFEVDERLVRQAISEVGKENIEHYYMPTGKKGFYTLARLSKEEDVNAFARTLKATMKTLYFNKYKPIKNYITDRALQDLMDQLELVFIEKED